MGRIRTIKPDFYVNEGLSALSEPAHLLAGGLLCYADDDGYFNANPKLIKAAIFPLRETSVSVPDMLQELSRIGYLRFGATADGRRWGQVVNFSEHQKVSHPTPSKIAKLEIVWESSGLFFPPEDSMKPPEPLRPERNGKEGNGKEKEGNSNEGDRNEDELETSARPTRGSGADQKPVSSVRTSPVGPSSVCTPRSSVENRHARIRRIVQRWYEEWAGEQCPWDGGEAGQLESLLKATPNWRDELFVSCLGHLARSDCIAPGSRPREWLGNLVKFLKSPLDRYWKPKQAGVNGNGASKAEQRNRDVDEATARIFSGGGLDAEHLPESLPGKASG
ncbi:MAG TPA: hypothetical protein VKZ53_18465 [Candidatus Angelobacter sp.]|nr:hypothetical protein [Candidatus Angelobacter sp.]